MEISTVIGIAALCGVVVSAIYRMDNGQNKDSKTTVETNKNQSINEDVYLDSMDVNNLTSSTATRSGDPHVKNMSNADRQRRGESNRDYLSRLAKQVHETDKQNQFPLYDQSEGGYVPASRSELTQNEIYDFGVDY